MVTRNFSAKEQQDKNKRNGWRLGGEARKGWGEGTGAASAHLHRSCRVKQEDSSKLLAQLPIEQIVLKERTVSLGFGSYEFVAVNGTAAFVTTQASRSQVKRNTSLRSDGRRKETEKHID